MLNNEIRNLRRERLKRSFFFFASHPLPPFHLSWCSADRESCLTPSTVEQDTISSPTTLRFTVWKPCIILLLLNIPKQDVKTFAKPLMSQIINNELISAVWERANRSWCELLVTRRDTLFFYGRVSAEYFGNFSHAKWNISHKVTHMPGQIEPTWNEKENLESSEKLSDHLEF